MCLLLSLFVALFVSFFVCLFSCLFVCLFVYFLVCLSGCFVVSFGFVVIRGMHRGIWDPLLSKKKKTKTKT